MSWYRIIFILFASTLLNTFPSWALDQEEMILLALNQKKLSDFDPISISPDGKWIAYVVKERRESSPESGGNFLSDGTPFTRIGCKIHLVDIEHQMNDEILLCEADSWSPAWSPFGNKIAFYSNASGICTLWIYDLTSKKVEVLSHQPINAMPIQDAPLRSSAGDEVFAIVTTPEKISEKVAASGTKGVAPSTNHNGALVKIFHSHDQESTEAAAYGYNQYLSGDFIAINISTKIIRFVATKQHSPLPGYTRISPSGKRFAFGGSLQNADSPSEMLLNLNVGDIDKADAITLIAHKLILGYGKIKYVWHPTRDILAFEKDKKIYLAHFSEKDENPQIIPLQIGDVEFLAEPMAFTQDGQFFVVGGKPPHSTNTHDSLFLFPLATEGSPIEISFQSPWKYHCLLMSDDSKLWQEKANEIVIILKNKSSREAAVVKVNIDQSGPAHAGEFLWQGLASLTPYIATKNIENIYWRYEDLKTPPNIYVTDNKLSSFIPLSNIEPALQQLPHSSVKIFETPISCWDGNIKKVKTTVLLPPNYNKDSPPPAIVLFYPGYLASHNAKRFNGGDDACIENFLFLEQGYAVIYPDIPITPEGTPSNRIQEITNALLPQVYHAINAGYVDPNRLGIMGHSYGGYGTAAVVSQTHLFRAAVALSGAYDLPGTYGLFDTTADFPTFNMSWSEHGQGGMGASPWDNLQRYLDNSPYYQANKIQTPLLIIHGEDDRTSPVTEAQKMFSALKRLKKQVELAIYPKQGHFIPEWSIESAYDSTERMLSFFNQELR